MESEWITPPVRRSPSLLAQDLLFYLKAHVKDCDVSPLMHDYSTIRVSVRMLLAGAAMAVHLLIMDSLGSAC